MVILGLTGSIGMGKSTAAAAFRRLGLPVHDADAAVRRLMGPGGKAVDAVAGAFPGVRGADGGIDHAVLGDRVFGDAQALARLEGLLHPLVRADETAFLKRCARRREPVVVLDIPLLFETGAEARCDAVVVVSAPERVQRRRVLRRPAMTEEKLAAILARQTPDREKRRRADFVVLTGLGRNHSLRQIVAIVETVRRWRGRHWPPVRRRPATNKGKGKAHA
jgi:dephospho-CoA kinase